MKQLNFEKLLVSDAARLSAVHRFGTSINLQVESVACHSFYVCFYAMIVADIVDLDDCHRAELYERAIVHDLDEIYSGDIIRPFKLQLKEHGIGDVLEELCAHNFQKIFKFNQTNRLKNNPKHYLNRWKNAKDDSLIGSIIIIADLMSVISFLWREFLLGNRLILELLPNVENYVINIRLVKGLDEIVLPMYEQFLRAIKCDQQTMFLGKSVTYYSSALSCKYCRYYFIGSCQKYVKALDIERIAVDRPEFCSISFDDYYVDVNE